MGFFDNLFGKRVTETKETIETSSQESIDLQELVKKQEEVKKILEENYLFSNFDFSVNNSFLNNSDNISWLVKRREFLKLFENYRYYDLVDSLISNIISDTLTPDISTGNILEIRSPRPEIQRELDLFQKRFDIDGIVNDIITDVLVRGEYFLSIVTTSNSGIIDIADNLDQDQYFGIYKYGFPEYFLKIDNDNFEDYQVIEPYKIAHFMLSSRKMKIKLDKFPKKLAKGSPILRVGKPMFFTLLDKIKQLIVLEQLIPALKIRQLASESYVSINLPEDIEPKQAFELCKRYENILNKKVGVDYNHNMLSFSDIIESSDRIKVIPNIGTKGNPIPMDLKARSDVTEIMQTIDSVRASICSAIGIPFELIYGGASSSEMIRKYSRYLRRIKSIQNSISNGILQICMAHFNNLGGKYVVTHEDFEVFFVNESVNLDELEKLEYIDATVGYLTSAVSFYNLLVENNLQDSVNIEDLKNLIRTNFP